MYYTINFCEQQYPQILTIIFVAIFFLAALARVILPRKISRPIALAFGICSIPIFVFGFIAARKYYTGFREYKIIEKLTNIPPDANEYVRISEEYNIFVSRKLVDGIRVGEKESNLGAKAPKIIGKTE